MASDANGIVNWLNSTQKAGIKSADFRLNVIAGTSLKNTFQGCSKLTDLNLSNFDTTNVADMSGMFHNCTKLTTLNLPSSFTTTNVANMSNMFSDCSSLTTLNLSKFTTTNVTNMTSMFQGCTNLTTLNLSNFTTTNVTNMEGMFAICSNLNTLDLSNFDTTNVTDMSVMFFGCTNLKTLDLSSFNTEKVTIMSNMFNSCSKLTTLNLSNFNTAKVPAAHSDTMFTSCFDLASVTIGSGYNLNLPNQTGKHTSTGATYTDGQWIAQSDKAVYGYSDAGFKGKADTYLAQGPYNAITFDPSPGTGGQSQVVLVTFGQAMPEISKTPPTREGYTFLGWYDAATGGTQYYKADGTSAQSWNKPGADQKLYAKWNLIIKGSVPVAVSYSLFTGGYPAKQTEASIKSETVEDLCITSLSVTQETTAATIFPNEAERNKVAVTLTPKDGTATSVPLSGIPVEASVLQKQFLIPKNSSLPVLFGLDIPSNTKIVPNKGPEKFARLSYVVGKAPQSTT